MVNTTRNYFRDEENTVTEDFCVDFDCFKYCMWRTYGRKKNDGK